MGWSVVFVRDRNACLSAAHRKKSPDTARVSHAPQTWCGLRVLGCVCSNVACGNCAELTSVVSRQANGLGAASSVKRLLDILLDRSVVYHEDGV
jgi:hypothetical protein